MKTTELAGEAVGVEGSPAARAALFERVLERVHRYFFRLTGDAGEAEELTQATLLELQRTLAEARYEAGRSFNTWMFLKAHAVFVGWCRRREREARPLPAPAREVPDPATLVQRRLDAQAILVELERQLGPETQECFVLRYEGGLGLDQVAEATGCTRRTVSRRLERAHALIDALLGRAPAAATGEEEA